ncbi:MAG: hypothetical protein NZ519_07660 [Bacteroidia bacterium]|nr:hypothetical protein [Bacteroidia bacterium]
MAKIEAGNDQYFFINGIPKQRGAYELVHDVVEGIDYIGIRMVGRDGWVEGCQLQPVSNYTDNNDTPFANLNSFFVYVSAFMFDSSGAGGGGGGGGGPVNWVDIIGKPTTFPPIPHTHVSTDISDFTEAVQDVVGTTLIGGTGIAVVYDDSANTITISSTINTSNFILQNGNAFGTAITIGSNDAQPLQLETNNTVRLRISDIGIINVPNFTGTGNRVVIASPSGDLSTVTISSLISGHTHTSSDITDFTEAVQDVVGATLVAGTGIAVVYNDTANTITISSTINTSNFILQHGNTFGTPVVIGSNDAQNLEFETNNTVRLSISPTGTINIPSLAGTGTRVVVTTPTGDLSTTTISSLVSSHTHVSSDITDFTEAVQDVVGTTLVAGSGISINYNDTANTITISSSGVDWNDITNKPATFPPSPHTHVHEDITDFLQAVKNIISQNLVHENHEGISFINYGGVILAQVNADLNYILSNGNIAWNQIELLNEGGEKIVYASDCIQYEKGGYHLKLGFETPYDLNISTFFEQKFQTKNGIIATLDDITAVFDSTDINPAFQETVQDIIAATLVAGAGITINYDDNANTITISSTSSSPTNAILQDGNSFGTAVRIGSNDIFPLQLETNNTVRLSISPTGTINIPSLAGTGTRVVVASSSGDLSTNTISSLISGHTHVSTDITDFTEAVQDVVGATLVAGSGISINYNDAANTITISSTSSSPTNAILQDGNSFGTAVRIGSNDAQPLQLETNNTVHVTLDTAGALHIGSVVSANAQLQVNSTSRGFLPPRMTTTQRNAVTWTSADAGMIIYNTINNRHQVYNGSSWFNLATVNMITATGNLVNGVFTYSDSRITTSSVVTATATNTGMLTGMLRVQVNAGSVTVRSVDYTNSVMTNDSAGINLIIVISL